MAKELPHRLCYMDFRRCVCGQSCFEGHHPGFLLSLPIFPYGFHKFLLGSDGGLWLIIPNDSGHLKSSTRLWNMAHSHWCLLPIPNICIKKGRISTNRQKKKQKNPWEPYPLANGDISSHILMIWGDQDFRLMGAPQVDPKLRSCCVRLIFVASLHSSMKSMKSCNRRKKWPLEYMHFSDNNIR